MMTQRHPRKLSSRTEAFRAKLEEANSLEEIQRLCLLHVDEVSELSQFESRIRQPQLLREIANLKDDGVSRLVRTFVSFPQEPEANYITLRNQLREIWSGSTRTPLLLNSWLMRQPSMKATQREIIEFYSYSYPPFICSLRDRKLIPNPGSLRAALVQAVLDRYDYLRICQNRACPAPYFVANRKDQKMCDNADCKAEAQRQFALDYWKREGHKQRLSAKRKKTRTQEQSRKFKNRRNTTKE
ncbi:MAG: hypothetical protein DMG65_07145 [Candidatus Angelobacter sp. Gp1-AA117]|nr:MAG: hypothetical protein DMG65_07145 [Candidatus Angelobacter sp. Gp1-AA117]